MTKYVTVSHSFDTNIRRLYVDVYINGSKYKGLLDTGSQDILVSDNLIKKLGLIESSKGIYNITKISYDGINDYFFFNLYARKNNKGFNIEEEGLDIILGVSCMLFSKISIDQSSFTFSYPTK